MGPSTEKLWIHTKKTVDIHRKIAGSTKKLWISTEKLAPSTGARMSLSN